MIDRKACYRQLHTIATGMGLSDEGYRERLLMLTGERSAKDLSDAQLEDAVVRFPVKQSGSVSQGHLRKPKALWISCWNLGALDKGNDAALDAFVKRQTGKERLAFLTPPEANKVTEALKQIAERHGFTVPKDDVGGIASRRALVTAQWKMLAGWDVVRNDEWAMNDYLCAAILKNARQNLSNFKRQHWDEAIRLLGRKIRKAMADRGKSVAA